MFESGMHPGRLVIVLLLEDGVCDGEVMFQHRLSSLMPLELACPMM